MLDDPLFWLLVLPGLILGDLCAVAYQGQCRQILPGQYEGWNYRRRGGAQLLDSRGLQDVKIEATPGMLTDHYDPQSKILRLSQDVYFTPSVAAAGIAAHEAGHAVQDAEDYLPMEANVHRAGRAACFKNCSMAVRRRANAADAIPNVGWGHSVRLVVPLCVPHSASSRAKQLLVSQGIIRGDEQVAGVQNVLGAAAWTYVAAAVSALGSWLFYVVLLVSQTRASADRS